MVHVNIILLQNINGETKLMMNVTEHSFNRTYCRMQTLFGKLFQVIKLKVHAKDHVRKQLHVKISNTHNQN